VERAEIGDGHLYQMASQVQRIRGLLDGVQRWSP
jgi:hypothetical protein